MGSPVIAVVGSRRFANPDAAKAVIVAAVARIAAKHPDATIVSGGAEGTDTWAVEAAKAHGLTTHVIRPDWAKHGKIAGVLRNSEIIAAATHVLAFWSGQSRGTLDSIKKARTADKPLGIWQEN